MFHTSDAPSPQGRAIHDQSIELNFSFPVKEAAAAGVKGLIVFQDDNRFFDRIECGTSAAEYIPASFNGISHAIQVCLDHVVRDGPSAAMDD